MFEKYKIYLLCQPCFFSLSVQTETSSNASTIDTSSEKLAKSQKESFGKDIFTLSFHLYAYSSVYNI